MATIKIKPGEEFLGIGLVGPLVKGPSGEFVTEAGVNLVRASIMAILRTEVRFAARGIFISGERFMRDDFGTVTKIIKHESIDDDLIALIESQYIVAVEKWEPRCTIDAVETTAKGESLETFLGFKIVGTNQQGNLVIVRNAQGKITFRPEI